MNISLAIPVFENGASIDAWKARFEGYAALMKLDEGAKMALIPLCFTHKKFDCVIEQINGCSTLNSTVSKLKAILYQEAKPEDPLDHFTGRYWLPHETVYEYIRELRYRATFITQHSKATDDLVKLQVIRSLPPSLKPSITDAKDVDTIAKELSCVPRPTVHSFSHHSHDDQRNISDSVAAVSSPSVKCYNCGKVGHMRRTCYKPKHKCLRCQQYGHLDEYCSRSSAPLATNQSARYPKNWKGGSYQ